MDMNNNATVLVLSFLLLVTFRCVLSAVTCDKMHICACEHASTNHTYTYTGGNLQNILEKLPTDIQVLCLRQMVVPEIHSFTFRSFPKLHTLGLDNNGIRHIHPSAFANLTNLRVLDLRKNNVTYIKGHTFSGLEHLSTLFLSFNKLQAANRDAFAATNRIRLLDLQFNNLYSIPPFKNLHSLEILNLRHNKIKYAEFPASYTNCTRLQQVILDNNQITTLEEKTFQALANTSLKVLNLHKNGVGGVEKIMSPRIFHHFRAIQELNLSANNLSNHQLKRIMDNLSNKNVKVLDLSDLRISHYWLLSILFSLRNTSIENLNLRRNPLKFILEGSFRGFAKLTHLDMSSCLLSTIRDKSFSNLTKLLVLNLQFNNLYEVPNCLPASLDVLDLQHNRIETIDNMAFGKLYNLKMLNLGNNSIKLLMDRSFLGLDSLRALFLDGNQIRKCPVTVFRPFPNLVSLTLAGNSLMDIKFTENIFVPLKSLVHLDLANNNCHRIQANFFKSLSSLRSLRLEDNRLGDYIGNYTNGSIFQDLKNLEKLFLMNNGIEKLPVSTFQTLSNLTLLVLAGNKISGWHKEVFAPTRALAELDLSSNLIARIDEEYLEYLNPSLNRLDLGGNPFSCYCDLRWFRAWMNTTHIRLVGGPYMCHEPHEWKDKPVISFNKTAIECLPIWSTVIACLIVLAVCAICYKKRWWIKLFIYKRMRTFKNGDTPFYKRMPNFRNMVMCRQVHGDNGAHDNYGSMQSDSAETCKYDAYISSSDDDHDWVVNNLLPGIDRGTLNETTPFGGTFRLYYKPRDSIPGQTVTAGIFENMSASDKVIGVLSRNYLNAMNLFELDLATRLMYEKKISQIIIIHIQQGLPSRKIPRHLMHTMRRNNVLEWTENVNAQELVKDKIINSLKEHQPAADMDAE